MGQRPVPRRHRGDGQEADHRGRHHHRRLHGVPLAVSACGGLQCVANIEASGTTTELVRDTANDQMARAGVQMYSLFAIVCDLMRDWRNTPGAKEVLPYLDKYMPVYGNLARHHAAAVEVGTIIPGEIELISGKNGSIVV
jgi:hypothetical protein